MAKTHTPPSHLEMVQEVSLLISLQNSDATVGFSPTIRSFTNPSFAHSTTRTLEELTKVVVETVANQRSGVVEEAASTLVGRSTSNESQVFGPGSRIRSLSLPRGSVTNLK